jgi:hypothetical protein
MVTDVGATRWVPWTLYNGVRTLMALAGPTARSAAALSVSSTTTMAKPAQCIEQLYLHITAEPYIITGNKAERRPLLGAYARSSARAGADTRAISGLEDAMSYELCAGTPGHLVPADARWLPDPAKIVAREDLGAGLLTWLPSQGAANLAWEMYAPTAGYLDPALQYSGRGGMISRPAMVMDGTAWMRLGSALAAGPIFSMSLVVMVRESKTAAALLSTYSDAPQLGDQPLVLNQESDSLTLSVGGGRLWSKPVSNIDRPVIITLASNGRYCWTVVTDHTPKAFSVVHSPLPPANPRMYLGRCATPGQGIMKGEILEVAIWNSVLTSDHLWQVASRLDAIYGVTR